MKKLLKKFSPMLAIVPVLTLPLVSIEKSKALSPFETAVINVFSILTKIEDKVIDDTIVATDYPEFTETQVDEFKTSLKSLKTIPKTDVKVITDTMTDLSSYLYLIDDTNLDKINDQTLKGTLKNLKPAITKSVIAKMFLGLKQADLKTNLPLIKEKLELADYSIKWLIGTSFALAILNLTTILAVVIKLKKQ